MIAGSRGTGRVSIVSDSASTLSDRELLVLFNSSAATVDNRVRVGCVIEAPLKAPQIMEKPKRGTGLVEPIALLEPVLKRVEDGEIDPRRLVVIDGELYSLDLRFRMLNNLELARAMGFTDSESTYEFAGNVGEVTRQIGNAVPVNMAKALVLTILKE